MHLIFLGNLTLSCLGYLKSLDLSCGCPDGYYEDIVTLDCLVCPRRCKTCINADECTECVYSDIL
jgi:hypothetical protein